MCQHPAFAYYGVDILEHGTRSLDKSLQIDFSKRSLLVYRV
jgi:hypothetical protein